MLKAKQSSGAVASIAEQLPPGLEPPRGGNGQHSGAAAQKQSQRAAVADGKEPISKRQRTAEAPPQQDGATEHSGGSAEQLANEATVPPPSLPESPQSPPTPPSEPGEHDAEQEVMEAASDLEDSQNLYMDAMEENSAEGVDFLPFGPETPPETPERANPPSDPGQPISHALASAAHSPAGKAQFVAVPGLQSIGKPVEQGSSQGPVLLRVPKFPWEPPEASAGGGPDPPGAGDQPGASSAAGQGARDIDRGRQPGGASTSGRVYGGDGPVAALLRQRRLCLVLDLDHTLVNSAKFSEVDPEHLQVTNPPPLQLSYFHKLPLQA